MNCHTTYLYEYIIVICENLRKNFELEEKKTARPNILNRFRNASLLVSPAKRGFDSPEAAQRGL